MSSIPHTGASENRDRAIVMGGGMTGLAAARVLSDHFCEVLLVEQDRFEDVVEHRRGEQFPACARIRRGDNSASQDVYTLISMDSGSCS